MIILRWALIALAFYVIALWLPGITIASSYTALVLALFWGIANVILKPILVVLTLPINILTLGLFTLVINGFLFWLLSTFIKGFYVAGFGWAMLGALLMSLASWGINVLLKKD